MCKATNGYMEPIFYTTYAERTLQEMIMEVCYKVQINENDGLSQQICTPCKEKLATAYHFQMMTITTDTDLRGMLSNLVHCKKEVDDLAYAPGDDRFEMVDISSFFDAEVKIEEDPSGSKQKTETKDTYVKDKRGKFPLLSLVWN
jgi:hypothetical protein